MRDLPPLPFHLGVIPTEVLDPADAAAGDAGDDVLEIELELDSQRISQSIQETLDGRCFARVTLLPYPENREEFLGQSEAEQVAHWLQEAMDDGADVLMTSRLTYSPVLRSSRNDKFWLNLPLYLVGGPFSFFVDDRSYFADAKLDVILYNLTFERSDLDASGARLLDQQITAEFKETSLDLADRASNDFVTYLLSLFVPAAFLSTENELVKSKVEEAAVRGLSEDLRAKIRGETSRLNANRNLSAFSLDLDRVLVARGEDGVTSLEIPIRLLLGSRGLSDYEIRCEGIETVSGTFPGEPDREGLHWIRETLSLPPLTRWIRVRVHDVHAGARAYTFRVDPDSP